MAGFKALIGNVEHSNKIVAEDNSQAVAEAFQSLNR